MQPTKTKTSPSCGNSPEAGRGIAWHFLETLLITVEVFGTVFSLLAGQPFQKHDHENPHGKSSLMGAQ